MCFSVIEITVLLEKNTVLNTFQCATARDSCVIGENAVLNVFQCARDSYVIGERHCSECVSV